MNRSILFALIALLIVATCSVGSATENIEYNSVIWGDATNGLRAGMRIERLKENHRLICLVFIENTNQTIFRGVLPDAGQRFRLRLMDEKRTSTQEKAGGMKFDTSRNPKEHLFPLAPDRPLMLASIYLDENFKMKPPGDHLLELHEMVFGFKANGKKFPIELPVVTSRVILTPTDNL